MSASGNEALGRAPLSLDNFNARMRALFREQRAVFDHSMALGAEHEQLARQSIHNTIAKIPSEGDIHARMQDLSAQRAELLTRHRNLTAQRVQLQERFEKEIQHREREVEHREQEIQDQIHDIVLHPRPVAPEAVTPPPYTHSDQIIHELRQENLRLRKYELDQQQTTAYYKKWMNTIWIAFLILGSVILHVCVGYFCAKMFTKIKISPLLKLLDVAVQVVLWTYWFWPPDILRTLRFLAFQLGTFLGSAEGVRAMELG